MIPEIPSARLMPLVISRGGEKEAALPKPATHKLPVRVT